jgi:hypothetical protein
MNKLLIITSLLIMTSCTMPWAPKSPEYHHPNLSGEVPVTATGVEGYQYPAIPLDEYNKMNAGSGN